MCAVFRPGIILRLSIHDILRFLVALLGPLQAMIGKRNEAIECTFWDFALEIWVETTQGFDGVWEKIDFPYLKRNCVSDRYRYNVGVSYKHKV
jgi:hypothetical protein